MGYALVHQVYFAQIRNLYINYKEFETLLLEEGGDSFNFDKIEENKVLSRVLDNIFNNALSFLLIVLYREESIIKLDDALKALPEEININASVAKIIATSRLFLMYAHFKEKMPEIAIRSYEENIKYNTINNCKNPMVDLLINIFLDNFKSTTGETLDVKDPALLAVYYIMRNMYIISGMIFNIAGPDKEEAVREFLFYIKGGHKYDFHRG